MVPDDKTMPLAEFTQSTLRERHPKDLKLDLIFVLVDCHSFHFDTTNHAYYLVFLSFFFSYVRPGSSIFGGLGEEEGISCLETNLYAQQPFDKVSFLFLFGCLFLSGFRGLLWRGGYYRNGTGYLFPISGSFESIDQACSTCYCWNGRNHKVKKKKRKKKTSLHTSPNDEQIDHLGGSI